jgi:hypothetical protein
MEIKFSMKLGKVSAQALKRAAAEEGVTVRAFVIDKLKEVLEGVNEDFGNDNQEGEEP